MRADQLFAFEDPGSETLRVPVLKVFDGDGFLTRIQHPLRKGAVEAAVRFGFIDAPEMDQPGGREAKDFLTHLIGDRWLELAVLLKTDTGQIMDRHGRIVCVPYLAHENQRHHPTNLQSLAARLKEAFTSRVVMRNIELEMVLNGWAWVLDRYCPEDSYYDALSDARRHRRGIWAWEDNIHPWEFKKAKYRARHSHSYKAGKQSSDGLATGQECPNADCKGKLVEKKGRFGAFIGCSNFPLCRFSRGIER